MKKWLLAIVLLVVGAPLYAQTGTFPLVNGPFNCHPAGYYAISSFSQFDCIGLHFGDGTIDTQFNGTLNFELTTSSWSMSELNTTMRLLSNCGPSGNALCFTTPANGEPGTFALIWTGVDMQGNQHSGTASGTWKDGGPNWRGWHWAVVLTMPLTINQ